MSEWRRGCTVGDNDKTQTQPGVNSRNFERDGDRGRRGTGATGTGATGSSSSGPRDSRPCHAFQRGECRYGSDCRYVHQEPEQEREQVREQEQSKEEDKEVALTHVPVPVPVVKKLKCPPGLFRSRDFLFKGISLAQRKNIVMDTVASFSVTESNMADKMSEAILQAAERVKPHDNVMFDGMACVGGNTISFAQNFDSVLANEFDEKRFCMLKHNAVDVLGIQNVTFFNGSILDLAFTCEYDILFLDPEWGGPDYKFKKQLRLTISNESVEDLCVNVMRRCPRVHTIALKLPVNYDNVYLQDVAQRQGLTYKFFSNYHKMTLTILQKRV